MLSAGQGSTELYIGQQFENATHMCGSLEKSKPLRAKYIYLDVDTFQIHKYLAKIQRCLCPLHTYRFLFLMVHDLQLTTHTLG
jgi:hypothetical protein